MIEALTNERDELWARIETIDRFIKSSAFASAPEDDQPLIERQLIAMIEHHDTLNKRIDVWAKR